ncbi:hypothetical protein JAAARDRAFT_279707 [Jaapia argillacea MUCL 33604]|uniref:Uncharacterized protein n=1 Tax=Jaapia argillacea MUCL 33604 TaxID=933084 RepID=A0A067PQF5_9AGAM|nr:hypothetical protein JAAARDRAFT_279707 [Jaapia argillacea MUCL 33604]
MIFPHAAHHLDRGTESKSANSSKFSVTGLTSVTPVTCVVIERSRLYSSVTVLESSCCSVTLSRSTRCFAIYSLSTLPRIPGFRCSSVPRFAILVYRHSSVINPTPKTYVAGGDRLRLPIHSYRPKPLSARLPEARYLQPVYVSESQSTASILLIHTSRTFDVNRSS